VKKIPFKESSKIWAFYKPVGLICTKKDPLGRPTLFDYINKKFN
jgi:23S rRNA pseudouridine2605 synthase